MQILTVNGNKAALYSTLRNLLLITYTVIAEKLLTTFTVVAEKLMPVNIIRNARRGDVVKAI